jgi:DegV family protein with EDD domain
MIRIVTDSTCDLPAESIARHGIHVMGLYIQMGELSLVDGVDITRDEFYARLPEFDPAPKTGAPGPEVFRAAYEMLAREGASEILSIHISERLSSTINSARLAAAEFKTIPVTVLDSGQLSAGVGFLAEKAAQLAQAGRNLKEILEALAEMMPRTYVFAALKTLEYLRRSGRMHFAVARLGELLRIKPLLHMNRGEPVAHRVRTYRRGIERLFEWLDEYAPFERLAIVHAGAEQDARGLLLQAQKYLPDGEIPILQITPVLGAHLGIGALGFACVRQEVKGK